MKNLLILSVIMFALASCNKDILNDTTLKENSVDSIMNIRIHYENVSTDSLYVTYPYYRFDEKKNDNIRIYDITNTMKVPYTGWLSFEIPKGKLSTLSILKSGKTNSKITVTISINHGSPASVNKIETVYQVSATSNPITIKGTFSANNFDVQ
jgi:hypothetical protein